MYTKSYFIYILTNHARTVLYIGMTNNLQRRLLEHERGFIEGFTKRYHVIDLIFFEETPDVHSALAREKQLKGWTRKRKIELIKKTNVRLETLLII